MQVKIFFERLDEELEKVNNFYTARENEFMQRGEALTNQLKILLDLKQVFNQRRRRKNLSASSELSSSHGGLFISRPNSLSTLNSDCSGKYIFN